jgi:ubiquinone/menaquinone biosynthesis C-methylase UbiE
METASERSVILEMTSELFRSIAFGLVVLFLTSPLDAQHSPGQAQGGHATTDHLTHRFENAEKWAEAFDDPARDQWQMPARVIETLNIKPGQIVADIGAGTGYFSVRLAKTPPYPKVYAIDIERSMVDYITRRATKEALKNIIALQAAAEDARLPEPVDIVLIVDTYHHIPNRVAYFTTLKRMLKPGAQLVIIDFKKGAPSGPPEEFRFPPERIGTELTKAGFALLTRHDFLPRQFFLVFGAR